MPSELDELQAAIGSNDRGGETPITRDLPCLGCGYNLRGLKENDRCPECGSPVGLSIFGDALRFSHPDWVDAVRRGLLMIFNAISLGLGAFIGLGCILGMLFRQDASFVILVVLPTVANTVICFGCYLTTAIEPRAHIDEAPITLRRFVRLLSIAAGFAVPIFIMATYLEATARNGLSSITPTMLNILRLSLLTWPAMMYGCLFNLVPIAKRIPDASLVFMTKMVLIGLPVSIALEILVPEQRHPTSLNIIIHISTGLFTIWTLVLIWLYCIALDAPSRAARRHDRRRRK